MDRISAVLSLALVGCGSGASSSSPPPLTTSTPVAASAPSAPAPSAAPSGTSSAAPSAGRVPFVLFLHGLGASGSLLVDKLGVQALAQRLGFAFEAPDGDEDSKGQRFWNAGGACCDFDRTRPDHSARLRRLLDGKLADPHIDPSRIYVVGFSNGAFMANRLACDDERIAGIGAIGGAGPGDGEPCERRAPLTVMAINGDRDKAVSFGGGAVLGRHDVALHPSATSTLQAWARRLGCTGAMASGRTVDLEASIGGDETAVSAFSGCPRPLELWVVHGGGHFSGTSPPAVAVLVQALLAAPGR